MANEGSPANPSLSGAQILAKLLALGALGAAFSDDVFAIKGSADATKLARFEVDGLTTATTRVYTLPDASIVVSGSSSALTSGRVPFATTGGLLTDSAALTWSGTSFATTATGAASFSTAGGYTSTVATGTAPFTATSTTVCPNLNAALLNGTTWTAPGAIGGGTPAAGSFTTLTASGLLTWTNTTDASAIGTAGVVMSGGLSVAKKIMFAGTLTAKVNDGATINFDCSDSAASRTVQMFRVNTSATAHTTQPLYDVISAASTSADLMVRVRANSVNLWTMSADGTASASGIWTHSNSTASTSTTTGALIVTGGVGIGGALFTGGNITANAGNTENRLTLGNSTNGYSITVLLAGSTHRAWLFGSQYTLSETFEIIPSTAAGGATFTTPVFSADYLSNVVLGAKAALATNATDGFMYMPTCAGTPTGVPTAFTGKVAHVYDTTNNKLYVYNGAWKATAALT